MIEIERALLQIEQATLATERARLAAAEDLLDLVNAELAAMQRGVDALPRRLASPKEQESAS